MRKRTVQRTTRPRWMTSEERVGDEANDCISYLAVCLIINSTANRSTYQREIVNRRKNYFGTTQNLSVGG